MDADQRRMHRELLEERRQRRDIKRRREALKSQWIARVVNSFRKRAADTGEAPQPERRMIELGSRRAADNIDKSWVCGDCGTINVPLRLLLCDLVRPVCSRVGCNRKAPQSDFDFSMNCIELNGICPIVDVKSQGKQPHCIPFATASMAEAQQRISSVCSGIQPEDGLVMNMDDVLKRYEGARLIYDINQTNDKWNRHTVQAMRLVAKDFGFESMAPDEKIYRFPYSATVKLSFDDICYMLAQGYPMLGVMIPGENFHLLKPGQIYKCPKSGEKHAILLIGAGRHNGIEYYHFLNSWGKLFCKAGPVGGYGLISADDILISPTAFLRHKEDLEEHKEHLIQEQPFPLDPSVHKLLEKIGLDCLHLGGKVVEQGTSDEMGVAAMSDSWVHDQEVVMVEQEGITMHFDASVDDTNYNVAEEQCTRDELRAIKDDNGVEENEKVVEQEGPMGIWGAAKDGVAVESQEEDGVGVDGEGEDGELGIPMGDCAVHDPKKAVMQDTAVEQFTSYPFRTTTEINAAQDQGMVESIDGKSNKDESQEEKENNWFKEQGEDGMSVRVQDKAVERCTSDQVRRTMDDNAAEDQ